MGAEPKLRAALVGCGRIGTYHVAAIEAILNAEIVAVCDARENVAAALASRHGVPHVFTDMGTMMRQLRPDVVHIATPPDSHVALATIAATYGAHIYLEKPFATTVDEADRILAAARAADVKVCAGHSRLFDPAFRDACRRIEAGEIGRVVSARAEQGFTYDSEARSARVPWITSTSWAYSNK
jgi:predicted dehydrogenase